MIIHNPYYMYVVFLIELADTLHWTHGRNNVEQIWRRCLLLTLIIWHVHTVKLGRILVTRRRGTCACWVSINSLCHKPTCAAVQRQKAVAADHSSERLKSSHSVFFYFLEHLGPLPGRWLKSSVVWDLTSWLFSLYCSASFPLTGHNKPESVRRHPSQSPGFQT